MLGCYRQRHPGTYIYPAREAVAVHWGHFSIVEAELSCLQDLLHNNRSWQYALDMAGSEVMMLTNRELVANLSAAPGQIYTESFPLPDNNQFRVEIRHKYEGPDLMSPDGPNDPPPFGLKIYKGAKAWRAPRTFVEFLLNHPAAKQFLEWAKYTYISDETVVATLARVSEVRWRRDGTWEVRQDHEPLGRYHLQLWDQGACRGVMRHGVCVFSLLDLSTILSANTILINKVMTEHDAAVAECLRDNIRKREVLE